MDNLVIGSAERDFYVWVNPKDFLTKYWITALGSFVSVSPELGIYESRAQTLMFIPNSEFKGAISPFQNNLLRNYIVEYDLELARQTYFPKYPCRLQVIFLLETQEEAERYRQRHLTHVGDRILKRVQTDGDYCYSLHDSSWVDFLRLGGSKDPESKHCISKAYWNGDLVQDAQLISMGEPWTQEPIIEVLFLGRVNFYDRSLDA